MIIKPIGTVSIPQRLTSIGGLLGWGRQVNTALQQLRDRVFNAANGGASQGIAAVPQIGPLVPVTTRPAFIAEPVGDPTEGYIRVWVTFGSINNKVATNFTDYFDINGEKKIFAKATFTTTGQFALTDWEISVEDDSFEIPAPDGPRPETGYYLLGATFIIDSAVALSNNGSGSLNVWPQVSNSLTGSTADTAIVWSRGG